MAGSGTGISAGKRAQQSRARTRRLPYLDVPKVEDPALARAFDTIAEHFRVYDGESNAPKERFVTLQELVDAGLVSASTKGGHSYIAQILNQDVSQKAGSTANPSLKGTVLKDTALGSRTPGGAGGSNNPIEQGKRGLINKLSDIGNVKVQSPAQRDFLYNDGGKWTNYPLFKRSNAWNARQDFAGGITVEGVAYSAPAAEVNDLSAAVTWANVPDANITESSVTQHSAAISTALSLNVANWDTAYGWGDHAGLYEAADAAIVKSDEAEVITAAWNFATPDLIMNARTALSDDSDGWLRINADNNYAAGVFVSNLIRADGSGGVSFSNANGFEVTSAAAVSAASFAATGNVTGANLNVANWDTAYGWGDHSGTYLPLVGGTLTGQLTMQSDIYIDTRQILGQNGLTDANAGMVSAYAGLSLYRLAGTAANIPSTSSNANGMLTISTHGGSGTGYGHQLFFNSNNNIEHRVSTNGVFGSWYKLHTTRDFADNSANWDTAYGWGDHAGVYLPLVGGTVTNNTFGGLQVNRESTTTSAAIAYSNTDGIKGYLGFDDTGALTMWDAAITSYFNVSATGYLTASGTVTAAGTDSAPSASQSRLSKAMLYLDGKEAVDGDDTYLRLNQNNDFTSGIYTPYNFRADGRIFVSSAIYIENGTTGSIQIGDTGITPTVDIGCRNSSYCHFSTTSTAGFYFYQDIDIVGTKNITKASHGNYVYHQSSSYNADQAGGITVSTSAASGGVNGDIWLQY